MTCIAFCGRYLAADTLGCRAGARSLRPHSKLALRPRHSYAVSGHYLSMLDVMVEWHQAGADPRAMPHHGGSNENLGNLLVISLESGLPGCYSHIMPYLDVDKPPIAFGSGGDYAMGAMLAGKNAAEAVKIAIGIDLHTGGYVEFIDLDEPEAGVQRGS